jgi:uncharacterized protein (TIGR02246 family)
MTEQEAIRTTLAQYAQRNDARDAEGWSQLFVDDARFVTQGGEYRGRPAIRDFVEALYASRPTRRTRHMTGSPVIVVEGDTAMVESDVIFFERFDDGPWKIAGANHYSDRLARQDTGWLFQERRLSFT